jgi:hypothetical protein
LDLPAQGRFFSTDFPWIEGQRLIQTDFVAEGEEVAWRVVFPIRGRYELTVVSQAEGSPPVESRFSLPIREDPSRLLNLGLLLLGLFCLGVLIGWVVPGSSAAAGLSLLLLAGVAAEASFKIEPARVGEPTPIRFDVSTAEEARIDFSVVRDEDHKRLFHIDGVVVPRSAVWSYHFYDGSPHRVTATARSTLYPDAAPLSVVERAVHVEGKEPPARVAWATYAVLLLPLAAGYVAGRWLRSKKL